MFEEYEQEFRETLTNVNRLIGEVGLYLFLDPNTTAIKHVH